jgi:GH24 family phage-related lysozyme (muramidase)
MTSSSAHIPSEACFTLIRRWEGLHRRLPDGRIGAYPDPVGIWTIGYGSIWHPEAQRAVQQGDVITQSQAEQWLDQEVQEKAKGIAPLCSVPLTQSMFDALVSFAYNVGIGAFEESTLRRKLNQKDYEGAAQEFDRWVKAGGSVIQGLVNRRNDEEALFRKDGWPGQDIQEGPGSPVEGGVAGSPPVDPAKTGAEEHPITIKVLVGTFFKSQVLGSQDLGVSEKTYIPEGTVLQAFSAAPDRSQHFKLILVSPITAQDGVTSLSQVFAYEPHIKIEGLKLATLIKLPVVYRRQIDNEEYSIFGSGYRQCNLTSNTMLADYLLQGELTRQAADQGLREPESVYMRILEKFGDTIDHDAQTHALKSLGIESYFSHSLSSEDLLLSLRKNVPVVVGFAYKGDGHICLLVGHDPDKKAWLVHDPYGTRHGYSDSYDIGVGGSYDSYSYGTMQQIFWDYGREAGWGRIVTSVKGQPTGLSPGL